MAESLFVVKEPSSQRSSIVSQGPPKATSHPCTGGTTPRGVLQYLPPSGNHFSLYGDPYAELVYIDNEQGFRKASYWLQDRIESNSFTEKEIALINFLSVHRCGKRSQSKKPLFHPTHNEQKVKKFIETSHKRGIITCFSWQSPCRFENQKKKPRVYGLSPIGCKAAEILFHRQLPREFRFQPVKFPIGTNPKMDHIFQHLVANELYCNMMTVDRVINWERGRRILLNDGSEFKTQYATELIKDYNEIRTLWIEVVRVKAGWYEAIIRRFQTIQNALERAEELSKPERIIVIADDDSRIPTLAELAETYLPDIKIRFTTDERLLSSWGPETFIQCVAGEQVLNLSPIPFLLPDYKGMTATEYRNSYSSIEYEDEFED